MKKVLAAIPLFLLLAACDPTPEEVAKMRAALPPGCAIYDLGSYGDVRHVVMVMCNGRQSRVESYQQQAGKTSVPVASIQIGG